MTLTPGQGSNNTFLNASPPKQLDVQNVSTSNFAGIYVTWCRGYILGKTLYDINLKVKGLIIYFLVTESRPKLLDVAISNFAGT